MPYLFASIKHRHWRTAGRRLPEAVVASSIGIDGASSEPSGDVAEADVVRAALATLPHDVRALLWHTEVNDESVGDVVARDGISAHHLAVKRHRARHALGTAYLAQHAEPDGGTGELDPACREALPALPLLVRNSIGVRRRRRLEDHLSDCERCAEARSRLERLNRRLRAHPNLPWSMWSAGLSAIKAQASNWLTASAVAVAGPSALAIAVLAPVPTVFQPDGGHAATATAGTPVHGDHIPTAAGDEGRRAEAGSTPPPAPRAAGAWGVSWLSVDVPSLGPSAAPSPGAPGTSNATASDWTASTSVSARQELPIAVAPPDDQVSSLHAPSDVLAVASIGDTVAAAPPMAGMGDANDGGEQADAQGNGNGEASDDGQGEVDGQSDQQADDQNANQGDHNDSDQVERGGNGQAKGSDNGQPQASGRGRSGDQGNRASNGSDPSQREGAGEAQGRGSGQTKGKGRDPALGTSDEQGVATAPPGQDPAAATVPDTGDDAGSTQADGEAASLSA
jgi:hypothetical protein